MQDTWRATPKLTVNYGLRYEFYFPESVNGKGNGSILNLDTGYLQVAGYGSINSDMNQGMASHTYNPRLGIAYQVNPGLVLRAGYGRSFDIGVFGSVFGHTATQNLPVLATQVVTNINGDTAQNTGYAFTWRKAPRHRFRLRFRRAVCFPIPETWSMNVLAHRPFVCPRSTLGI